MGLSMAATMRIEPDERNHGVKMSFPWRRGANKIIGGNIRIVVQHMRA
jgi:hypothetical protein